MRSVWRGQYIEVCADGRWEYVRRTNDRGAAAVLAITDDGCIVLVEQYRVPLGKRCLELPAGLIDDGEDSAAAAARELAEETGFRAGKVEVIGEFASSPGLTAEAFTLVRAGKLIAEHEGGGVDGENITVHRVPVRDLAGFVAAMRAKGVMIDVRLLVALPHL